MKNEIEIITQLVPEKDRKTKPNPETLAFGTEFTDHMFIQKYQEGKGWLEPKIVKLEDFKIHPAALVLHYGQEIFEGLKAFKQPDGKITMFRPDQNIKRFNESAKQMCMPEVNPDVFLEGLVKLLKIEEAWVPELPGTALYIRPTMIATEPILGVRTSSSYYFYIILSPVGPYFKTGFQTTKIYVETEHVRAVRGGVGEAKTGGNYAASLLAGKKAKAKGYAQVMWLDALERKYVEEVGAMNMMFVIDNTVVTPPLTGSILHGITRESVIKLCKDLDINVEERRLSIDEITQGIVNGKTTEAFGTGTAASITPVGEICYKNKNYVINDNKIGPITQKLYDTIIGIQRGTIKDKFNWTLIIE